MDIPDSYKNFEKIVSYNESEQQMDNLDVTDTHYDKKISDLQRRLDAQYDRIDEVYSEC